MTWVASTSTMSIPSTGGAPACPQVHAIAAARAAPSAPIPRPHRRRQLRSPPRCGHREATSPNSCRCPPSTARSDRHVPPSARRAPPRHRPAPRRDGSWSDARGGSSTSLHLLIAERRGASSVGRGRSRAAAAGRRAPTPPHRPAGRRTPTSSPERPTPSLPPRHGSPPRRLPASTKLRVYAAPSPGAGNRPTLALPAAAVSEACCSPGM